MQSPNRRRPTPRRSRTALGACLATGAIVFVGPFVSASRAQETKQEPTPPPVVTEPPAMDAAPELVIAGRTVMRLRSRAGGLTPDERAFSLRQRLGPILTLPNLTAEDVVIRQQRAGQSASIFVRGRLLVTVDRNLALANNTSIEGLAAQWARNLQVALPQVNVTVRMSGTAPVVPPRSTVRTGNDAGVL